MTVNEDAILNKSVERYYLKKLKNNPDSFKLMGDIGKGIESVYSLAVELKKENIAFVPAEIILNNPILFEILIKILPLREDIYKNLEGKLKENKEVTTISLTQWETNVEYAPQKLVNDRGFVLELINKGLKAFDKLPDIMQNDEDLCEKFLSKTINAYVHSKKVKLIHTNKNLALIAIASNPILYSDLSIELKSDSEIINKVLGHQDMLKLIDFNLWTKDMVTKALNTSPDNWMIVHSNKIYGEHFYSDKDCICLALNSVNKKMKTLAKYSSYISKLEDLKRVHSTILNDMENLLKDKRIGFRECLDHISGGIDRNIMTVLMNDEELSNLVSKHKIAWDNVNELDFTHKIREAMLWEKLSVGDTETTKKNRAKI